MVLTERHEKAVAINCTGRKVLTYDLAKKTSPYHLYAGGYAAVIKKSKNPRYNGMRIGGRLMMDYEKEGDGIFWVMQDNACLTKEEYAASFVQFAQVQSAPVIEEGDRFAILCFDMEKNYTEVHTVIARKVNDYYSNMAVFEEESEEETMPGIKKALRF